MSISTMLSMTMVAKTRFIADTTGYAHGLPRGSMARAAFHETLLTDAITGIVTDAEWRKRVAARLGTRFDPAEVAQWSMGAGEVHTGTLAVLQSARSAVPLGLVSNATTRLADDLCRLRIAAAFDFIVNSSAIGCHKPFACFYEHALRRCGCTREQVFLVDDRPDNVAGAAAFGFQAHLFRDTNTLEQALRDAGVLPKSSPRRG